MLSYEREGSFHPLSQKKSKEVGVGCYVLEMFNSACHKLIIS
jgi:hypothetical protein